MSEVISNKSISYALSGYDILEMLKGKTNIIMYNELYKIKNIDEVIKYGTCVILYNTSEFRGHWCCLIVNNDRIEFFDPYGILIDDEIKPSFMSKLFIKKYYSRDKKRLQKLIYYSKYDKVEYNNYPVQKRENNINTCGRHVVTRILMKDLLLEEYIKYIYSFKGRTPDEVVLSITNNII